MIFLFEETGGICLTGGAKANILGKPKRQEIGSGELLAMINQSPCNSPRECPGPYSVLKEPGADNFIRSFRKHLARFHSFLGTGTVE